MFSASKSKFLIVAFIFQFLASVHAGGNCSKNKNQKETLPGHQETNFQTTENQTFQALENVLARAKLTALASKKNVLSKDMSQFLGKFLQPETAHKMKQTSKQWGNVNIYKNIFPNEREMAVFRNVNTEKIIWESIQCTELWLRQFDLKFDQEKLMHPMSYLVSHLKKNDSAKWNNAFVWIAANWWKLKYKSQYVPFLKALMLPIAENVAITFTYKSGESPLMLAAEMDDTDSILAFLKRNANVNQQDENGWTALHYASVHGSINACATLLDNDAHIDAVISLSIRTPLMLAAMFGRKKTYDFLIEKGANQTLIDINGKTASQYANFHER